MRGFKLSLAIGSLILLTISSNAFGQQTRGWTPDLAMKVKSIGTVRVSPDGQKVAYTVSDAVMTPEKSEFVTQIWLANSDGSNPLQLTFADKSSDNPRWSPDGRLLAFTSGRSGKTNLYVLRVIGGEAEQITESKSGVANFAWSPKGDRIAFLMKDAESDDEEKNSKGKDDSRWVDENVKINRLYVVSLEKDAGGKREPRKLTTDQNIDGDIDWSPDGKSIVFARTKM